MEAMRSRNRVPRVSEMRNYPLYRSDVRVVSGNAVVQRDFVFITFKKYWLAPSELVHLLRERVLPKTLFSTTVTLEVGTLGVTKTHGTNRIQ